MPAFPHHVAGIVFHGSDKKMIGVYARWVVANMQRAHPRWDRASVQL